jgi:hypothetical protein
MQARAVVVMSFRSQDSEVSFANIVNSFAFHSCLGLMLPHWADYSLEHLATNWTILACWMVLEVPCLVAGMRSGLCLVVKHIQVWIWQQIPIQDQVYDLCLFASYLAWLHTDITTNIFIASFCQNCEHIKSSVHAIYLQSTQLKLLLHFLTGRIAKWAII